ncbi:hypothetical protein IW262DRAFT_1265202 [Armillaria fumosa]|nr:hypothetical protein IW262DRAFT_1265202 [Armillaria fumosa]
MDPLLGSNCTCSHSKWIVQCRDCMSSYGSREKDKSIMFNFGHGSDPCPLTFTMVKFTLIDCNGMHGMHAQFCSCLGVPNRVEQLLLARMCPATVEYPATAFRFNVLDHFLYTHLEGKLSMYDFVGMLQVLMDYWFSERVLVYTFFINSHMVQKQRMMDGNFNLNMLIKNSNPNDHSLFKGNIYFADKIPYQKFVSMLKALSDMDTKKRVCHQMKADNNQDKKKWQYMSVTGQGNCSCSHSFIEASAEQGNMDNVLSHSMALYRVSNEPNLYDLDMDEVVLYDIACSYSVNALKQFKSYWKQGFTQYHPDLIKCISHMHWGILMLHIQNHKEICRITKNMAYMDQIGHFYGEQTEYPRVEFNQVAPQA